MTIYERAKEEQNTIRKAMQFENDAILADSTEPNPYRDTILAMQDGAEIWEAINEYFETWGAVKGLQWGI